MLYALIAKGTFVLAEYEVTSDENDYDIQSSSSSSSSSNTPPTTDFLSLDVNKSQQSSHSNNRNSPRQDAGSMARKVLGRIPRGPGMHSYLLGDKIFTYNVQNDLLVMCMSHSTLGHDVPSCFLNELLTRPELRTTSEASVLTRVLRDMLEPKESAKSGLFGTAAKLAEAEEKLDSVTSVVKDNIRKVINRSEHIDSLMSRASDLSSEAFTFRDSSRKLHHQLWCMNIKKQVIFCLVAIFFCLLLSVVFLCGAPWDVSDIGICRRIWGQGG